MGRFFRGFLTMGSRFFLLIVLNILICVAAMAAAHLICAYFGISMQDHPIVFYIIFYSLIGFGGAFISLHLSIYMAKKAHGVRILQKPLQNSQEQKIVNKVETLARKAGLSKPPQVGIYESPEVNAFATGPRRNKSLVAVSTGLLNCMNEDEVEGVLAHEVAHVANGDMITMTLLMGLVNTMVFLLARIVTNIVMSRMNRRSFFLEFMIYTFFQVIFSILGSILILNPFSKRREYKADKGGASLAGKSKMIQALKKLQTITAPIKANAQTAQYGAFKISTGSKKSNFIALLFSTHPPIEKRIHRLERMNVVSPLSF